MTSDTYDDFDDRADLATADETIRRLKAKNERLRAEVEFFKDQNQAIASSYADHMSWHREMKAKIKAALSWVKPYPRPVSDDATIDMMVRALRGGDYEV